VHEQHVSGLRRSDQRGQRRPDVLPRGLRVRFVRVDQHGDVVFGEAVTLDEALAHPPHVVYATFELRLGARVVDSDQHCLFRH